MTQPTYSARVRPFAIPHRLEELAGDKASGVVTLPLHVEWSERRSYDLDDRADRRRVYEQVLREGTLDDVKRYIDVDGLIDLWDELFLPSHIAAAWAALVADGRGVQLARGRATR